MLTKQSFIRALRGGLSKTAATPGNVKQFRRALAILSERKGPQLLHTTDKRGRAGLQGVLETGQVNPSFKIPGADDVNAAHGAGTYWLRGRPDLTYFSRPSSEGVVVPAGNVALRSNASAVNELGQPLAPNHALSAAYTLRGGDTAVVDWTGRMRDLLNQAKQGTLTKDIKERWDRFRKGLLPTTNPEGLDPKQYEVARRNLHRTDPELQDIKFRPGVPLGARDQMINAYVTDMLGDAPRGGLRAIDSRVFNLANQKLPLVQSGQLDPASASDIVLRTMYKQQLGQRRALRAQGLLPQLQSLTPKPPKPVGGAVPPNP